MQTKLTLRLEDQLIEQAKSYAAHAGKSVSQIVSDYFTFFKVNTFIFSAAYCKKFSQPFVLP